VALYRFERDGWTIQDVAAEMRRQTYREGWLPGYVYGMVKAKPGQDLFDPAIQWDHNLAVDVVPAGAISIGAQTIPPREFEPAMTARPAVASKNAVHEKEATDVR
jgi:hypothetical protein